jgi:hypothetical protein
MSWMDNAAMFWNVEYAATGTGSTQAFYKVTDHNRSPLAVNIERIEKKQRMADGTLRRYVVSKKRSWSCSWEDLPDKKGVSGMLSTVDGGMSASEMEYVHDNTDGEFQVQLRDGAGNIETVLVMISDFSKDIKKRGQGIDFWDVSITLEEC